MNDWRPVTSMTVSRADSCSASARARQSLASATGSLANWRTLARPLEMSVVADHRVERRQRPVDVEVGQLGVPQLLDEAQRRLRGHLGPAHLVGDLGRLGVGVAEDEGRGGQDQQLAVGAAELGQPALHVLVERLPVLESGVPGEDRVGRGGGEVAALVGVAGLEDDRPSLRRAGDIELAADVEEAVVVLERAGPGHAEELAALLVGDDFVAVPGVPQLGGGLQEGAGPVVAVALGEEAAAPEVLPGEGVPAGDDVPGGPAAGQVVERRELAGHLVGLVEGRVDRPGQPEVLGHRRQGGEDGERVRAADHVQVVDLAVLLPQPQPLGQEHEVELAPLSGLGEVAERLEFDVAAPGRVAPHGGVVDAGEMRGKMDLLERLAHGLSFLGIHATPA